MPHRTDQQLNRDDEQRSGSPPRSAYEPIGSEASTQTPKAATDPATGEPKKTPPAPNRSDVDQTDGA